MVKVYKKESEIVKRGGKMEKDIVEFPDLVESHSGRFRSSESR